MGSARCDFHRSSTRAAVKVIDTESVLCMEVRLVTPPPGVVFAIQQARSDLLFPLDGGRDVTLFRFSLRLGAPLKDGSFNFLGEFAQGTPADRFVYINSGVRAGQAESRWDRAPS